MKRQSCSRCQRPVAQCFCHTLQQRDNRWPVRILQHPGESGHAIGTARIAALSLSHCQLDIGENFSRASLFTDNSTGAGQNAVLIYPGEDATPLASLQTKEPQTLIFLDASWRKSRRMLMESPALQALPKVALQPGHASRYRIRKSKQRDSLSTLEAIVHSLAFLEQDEEKYLPLLHSMDWMIDQQIALMGEAVFTKNYGHTDESADCMADRVNNESE
ncbi:MAG: DTW domain-containing protein [Gammaproteobacteria bacterium]|nr:DTW domain-containing protein [Gammaproteobacteria bacterium]MBQ0838346.1 DTW domain-containing protein [Gammaproteobacteria bacterium]